MDYLHPDRNIEGPVSVNPEDELEAERIEDNPEAMLRLIDVLFFLKDDDCPPS